MSKNKIGVLGLGVVGDAIFKGMLQLGHSMFFYDPKIKNSKFVDVLETDICFICVPTPPDEKTGRCDISIVEESLKNLQKNKYDGIVAIKSTVEPGTTEKMIAKFNELNICFVPEFLRERCALTDFIQNHDVCLIGTHNPEVFEKIKNAHGTYPKVFKMLKPTEAELVKYYNNIYNATLITLANSFYEVCKTLNADYSAVKNSLVIRDHINDSYLECNENFRGFGGVCLPKDTLAIAKLVEEHGLDVEFFKMLICENKKYKVTVYEGMRI